jgi:hypothetical protein
MHVCLLCAFILFFLAIESNDECTEEGEILEYQEEEEEEEDQGQATKASHLFLMHI